MPLVLNTQIVPIQVTNIAADDNAFFQMDQNDNADIGADTVASPTPARSPDFPISASQTGNARMMRSARSASSPASQNSFNPTQPPAYVTKALLATDLLFGTCVSVLEPDNYAHDQTSGAPRGFQTLFGYRNRPINPAAASMTLTRTPIGIDSGQVLATPSTETYTCSPTGLSYLNFGICESPDIPVRTVSGHSEIQLQTTVLNLSAGVSKVVTASRYAFNRKNVFYPAVAASPLWGPRVVHGAVSFPPAGSWTNCTAALARSEPNLCHGLQRASLVTALEEQGYVNPASSNPQLGRFEAHHVQPISWGTTNFATNGVWIPLKDHAQFTQWFLKSNFSLAP